MRGYRATIGLEIHAELRTRTKMFCGTPNDPSAPPNTNVCPVCAGHPGTLPVVNHEAVRHVLRVGAAVGGTLADFTEFDRKNYFYPDLPKGYQISQFDFPLVRGGELAGVALTRIHLEEDTATSRHEGAHSLIDFNRAGVPLMELVTEPVVHDAETASRFARELQLLLRTLGAGTANMDKGEMRVEANISVSRDESLGTKVEVKNLNSFRSVERAIEYEINRQVDELTQGRVIVQETRGFDEDRGHTFSQRAKESSHDYRYFPEPDIPKLHISSIPEFAYNEILRTLPELPDARRARYEAIGLKGSDIEVLVADAAAQEFFDTELTAHKATAEESKVGVNYLLSDIRGSEKPDSAQEALRGRYLPFVRLVTTGELSSRGAKELIKLMQTDDREPSQIAKDAGLVQQSGDEYISRIAEKVIEMNANVVEEIRGGKRDALKFLVGVGMKESKGAANPALLLAAIEKRIS